MRVANHKPGPIRVKVPLGASSLENFIRAEAEPGKDHSELLHPGNVVVMRDIFE